MPTQIEVAFTPARPAGGHRRVRLTAIAAIIATALPAAGCNPVTTPSTARDPADPASRVAGVGYRSTISPYTSMRPVTPSQWRERNDSVAPQPDGRRAPQ